MTDQKRWLQQLQDERDLKSERDALAARLALAEAALTRAGYTQLSHTNHWKPPVGPSMARYLDEIERLSAQLELERAHHALTCERRDTLMRQRDECAAELGKFRLAKFNQDGDCNE